MDLELLNIDTEGKSGLPTYNSCVWFGNGHFRGEERLDSTTEGHSMILKPPVVSPKVVHWTSALAREWDPANRNEMYCRWGEVTQTSRHTKVVCVPPTKSLKGVSAVGFISNVSIRQYRNGKKEPVDSEIRTTCALPTGKAKTRTLKMHRRSRSLTRSERADYESRMIALQCHCPLFGPGVDNRVSQA